LFKRTVLTFRLFTSFTPNCCHMSQYVSFLGTEDRRDR
jgi:hypothetical protein